MHSAEQSLECPGCKTTFTRVGALMAHIERTDCPVLTPSEYNVRKAEQKAIGVLEALKMKDNIWGTVTPVSLSSEIALPPVGQAHDQVQKQPHLQTIPQPALQAPLRPTLPSPTIQSKSLQQPHLPKRASYKEVVVGVSPLEALSPDELSSKSLSLLLPSLEDENEDEEENLILFNTINSSWDINLISLDQENSVLASCITTSDKQNIGLSSRKSSENTTKKSVFNAPVTVVVEKSNKQQPINESTEFSQFDPRGPFFDPRRFWNKFTQKFRCPHAGCT
jgi:hypothetical protein